MKQILGGLMIFILVISCKSDSKTEQIHKYFDLKGLVEKQITSLNNKKPTVRKSIEISNQVENQQVRNINWSKELELFTQADLNKPAFIQSYEVDSSSMGVKYTLKNTEKLPVKYLNISRLVEDGISIEALINTDNYLYQTERHLRLAIKHNELTDYQIDGFQKIIFGDRKSFKINGKIIN